MAITGNKAGSFNGQYPQYATPYIFWSYEQSIPNNNTVLTATLKVKREKTGSTTNKASTPWSITIGGTKTSGTMSFKITNVSAGEYITIGTASKTISHSNEGTISAISISAEINLSGTTLGTGSVSTSVTPNTIPRYGTSNQSLNYKTETTINMNWSSDNTVDYIWYSTNNGSSWTGVDVTDGTSGTYNITGLTPNTAYNIKTRIRRKDSQLTTDSTALSVTTYKVPTNSLSSATETSITVAWSVDTTADYIWYSKDNGKTWVDVGGVSTTSGSYMISGLSSNTYYEIKTRVRRKATQSIYDTATLGASTYNYPYCTKTPNFTIGDNVTFEFYNPLGRYISVDILNNSNTTIVTGYGTSGTTLTSTATDVVKNALYNSIPKATSMKYRIKVTYNGIEKIADYNNTYSIRGTEKPVFTNFTYKDTNTTVTNVLGSDQYLVKGLSNLQVTVLSANKMVGSNSATPKNYVATLDNLNTNADYSTNDVNLTLGTPVNAGTKRLTVTAHDYRGLNTSVYKDVIVFEHSKPVVNVDIKRLNNFEAETTLKVSGSYSRIIINGTDKNTIIGATYRYREAGGDWSSEKNLNCTINNGEFTCSDVVLSLDNDKEFEFEISIKDKLQVVNRETIPVGVGQAVFFISSNKKQCYINGKLVKGSLEVSSIEPTNDEELWIQKRKNLFNSSFQQGYYNTSTGVHSSATKYICSVEYTPVLPTKKYTISSSFAELRFIYVYFYNNKKFLSSIYSNENIYSFTFEIPAEANQVRISLQYLNNITPESVEWVQIEQGSTATEYEAYIEEEKIWLKNDNGVYEEFLNVETINNHLKQIDGGKVRVSFSLYDNSSGNNGTITLSDSVANYNILEIFYRDNNGNDFNSTRVFAPNGKNVSLFCIEANTITNIRTSRYAISGTSMTLSSSTYTHLPNKDYPTVTTNNYLYVTKVIGYK